MKLLYLILFLFLTPSAKSQMKILLQGGYNHSKFTKINFTTNPYGESYETSWLSGFNLGIVSEIKVDKDLYLQPGILIQGKGTHMNYRSDFDTNSRIIQLHYLDIPVILKFKSLLTKKIKSIIGAGFYGAKSIRGVEKGSGSDSFGPYIISNKVKFSNKNENQKLPTVIKPLDFGYSFVLGVEVHKLEMSISFSQSFSSITPNKEIYHGNFKNSTLSIFIIGIINKN